MPMELTSNCAEGSFMNDEQFKVGPANTQWNLFVLSLANKLSYEWIA